MRSAEPGSETPQGGAGDADLPTWEARLLENRFASSGTLRVARHLASLAGEEHPWVLLALGLALSAPGRGDVCAHLGELPGIEGWDWPPLGDWLRVLRGSGLVQEARGEISGGEELRPLVLEGPRLYLARYHDYEVRVARCLRERAGSRPAHSPDPKQLADWAEALFSRDPGGLQRKAATHAAGHRLTVLTGGPGTGKTFTVCGTLVLLQLWHRSRQASLGAPLEPLQIALAAPTGKAAARMTESLRAGLDKLLGEVPRDLLGGDEGVVALEEALGELEATTLHRLLGYQHSNPSRFRYHGERPLPHQVVVVDETSMVDVAMVCKLLEALAPEAHLLFLGDADQLVSVECGSVMADLCAPGGALEDSVVRLRESHRFRSESGLGTFVRLAVGSEADPGEAARVLTGRRGGFDDLDFLSLGPRGELPREVRDLLRAGYRPYLDLLREGQQRGQDEEAFHRQVLEEFGRFRVLCAHRTGSIGVEGFNRLAIGLLEREGLVHPYREDWLGRPVLVTENDYAVERTNGDIGVVVERGRGEDRYRVVAFLAGAEGVSYLPLSRLPAHRDAFALTIHKSQGSEFENVLVVLPGQESRLATRELVYTGVTRARQRVTTLGREEVLRSALGRPVQRASGLRERLAAAP